MARGGSGRSAPPAVLLIHPPWRLEAGNIWKSAASCYPSLGLAMLAAAGSTATGPFNVGTGVETDVLELVRALGELGGAEDFEPEFAPPRTGEVQRISIDPARAKRELGWEAKTGLDEGLRLTLASI